MATIQLERRRQAALEKLGVLDTPPEDRFERITRIARSHYGVKIALFSLLDNDRQWFKSRQGTELEQTPRSIAFCDYAIQQEDVMVVIDATKDTRFCDNPLLDEPHNFRFYAGMPVREPGGFRIGTLCIIDDRPRSVSDLDLDVLRSLASIIEDELERSIVAADKGDYLQISLMNRAIHRAQNMFLSSTDDRAAFEQVLHDLLTLTGSQFGFIGEVRHRESDQPFLQIDAISNIAWSDETEAFYQQIERRGMVFENVDNLLGRPMMTGEVIISDNVTEDPRGGGLPQGHPQLNTYIGIPVFSGEKQVGLIGLANRLEGYRKGLAEELAPLLQTIGNLIGHKRLYEEKLEHKKSLEKAANYDTLTGLPNRRRLTKVFHQEVTEADKRKGRLAVCFIDLDGFKAINDEHGHSVGDAVLKTVANRLRSTVRSNDTVGRLGGDEFVAILRDVDCSKVYNRLLEAIRQPIKHNHLILSLSASMGVTVYPNDNADTDLLLRHADQAMYAAKESGKNGYKLFDLETHQSREERVRVLEQIDTALKENQLVLYYQPKLNLKEQTIDGFEALIRWNHPEEGVLSPYRFLEQIEYTEYAREVGLFVLNSAVEVVERFIEQGLPYTLSINLSPSHFLSEPFPDDIEKALEGRNPEVRKRLTLEILETTALDDTDRVIRNLGICQKLGVGISLDDFGTGYSSLTYFRMLPAQEIKIDRSFVQGMTRDGENAMIVQAIANLSQSFNRRTVAEGIETQDLEEQVIDLGCEIGQGYLYSKPVPFAEVMEWARRFTWENRYEAS
ncbi:EAL domain-containing protein [Marinobacter sp. F4216]|uniref:sensor domain-containing phosphodiesterase n=1 Tax=Marinobacter sp. F4216 TaxID=2874281 RepID=UPI001CBB5A9F|nr:EAL domain-containing protein [Marinobacter sp. F4216]MBZ2169561.1 EAL domain-containing protein [Marinobacter sp. F4216]